MIRLFGSLVPSFKFGCLCLLLSSPLYAEDEQTAASILEGMSSDIAALQDFEIVGDGYTDARLPAGQIIEHATDVRLRIGKPDMLRLTHRTAEETKEVFFGQQVLTVFSETSGFYAQHSLPAELDTAVDFAINKIGIDAPVLDFISSDVASHLTEDADSVDYLGLSLFRGKLHHHIAIRTPEIDVQVWVSKELPRLPGKVSISAKWEAGAPRSVFFFDWNTQLSIKRGDLGFEPPKGATKIEFDLEYSE